MLFNIEELESKCAAIDPYADRQDVCAVCGGELEALSAGDMRYFAPASAFETRIGNKVVKVCSRCGNQFLKELLPSEMDSLERLLYYLEKAGIAVGIEKTIDTIVLKFVYIPIKIEMHHWDFYNKEKYCFSIYGCGYSGTWKYSAEWCARVVKKNVMRIRGW